MPPPRVIGFCGASNSGKTTLAVRVISELTNRGLKVGAVKHHGHPGSVVPPVAEKDTQKLQTAGAERVVLIHSQGVWLTAGPDLVGQEPLAAVREFLPGMDLVIVEGFKAAAIDKIEVVAPGREPLLPPGGRLLALVMRGGGTHRELPVLNADHPQEVACFILKLLGFSEEAQTAGICSPD